MTTKNTIAKHIATKSITKHMGRDAAAAVWKELKLEGWEPDLNIKACPMLAKHDEDGTQRFFSFKTKGTKIAVSYMELEVV